MSKNTVSKRVYKSFNRTSLELKRCFNFGIKLLASALLIEPVWN